VADHHRIGSLKRQTVGSLAEKAAMKITKAHRPTGLAVACCPEGTVTVEPFDQAVPDDVVGTYNPDAFQVPRWLYLGKRITEDLRHHWNATKEAAA
jgi:hypothetical protein